MKTAGILSEKYSSELQEESAAIYGEDTELMSAKTGGGGEGRERKW